MPNQGRYYSRYTAYKRVEMAVSIAAWAFTGLCWFVFPSLLVALFGPEFSKFSSSAPFAFGICLSATWGGVSIAVGWDIPGKWWQYLDEEIGEESPVAIEAKAAIKTKAAIGFFLLLVGILGMIAPYYLRSSIPAANWLVTVGGVIGLQMGLSLFMNGPLRRLSFSSGYLVFAILLHSMIIREPTRFANEVALTTAKVLVLVSLIFAAWFLSRAIFWNYGDSENFAYAAESRPARGIRSIVGVFSTFLTIIEFINILYSLFGKGC